jgi:hypothetical protein
MDRLMGKTNFLHEARRLVDTESDAVVQVLAGLLEWATEIPVITNESRMAVALLAALTVSGTET